MLTILDCNNFWSPSGGGVRRYQLEKMKHLADRDDVRYVFVMPDDHTGSENVGSGVTVEHVRAPIPPGGGQYRAIVTGAGLREVVQRHHPDIIEVGSPYVMPGLARAARRGLKPEPALVGFWHADFARAYIGRFGKSLAPFLERPFEAAAWWWARRGYGRFDATFVASEWVARNMIAHGVDRLFFVPLGVDSQRFDPEKRDPTLVSELASGDERRVSIFFPHRFQEEKGLRNLLRAYPLLCEKLAVDPALVFAGTGPDLALVEDAVARYPHVRYLGYIQDPDEMARWYASCDLAVGLSAFETFGLSIAEAMASGLAVVSADAGAGAELVTSSGCGATVPYGDTEALVQAIIDLVHEGKLRERGRRGRNWVSRFTWEATFERELACYRDILAYRSRGIPVPPGFHT